MRGFLGYMLDDEIVKGLQKIQDIICELCPKFRKENKLHTTIAFLGDEIEKFNTIDESLLEIKKLIVDNPIVCEFIDFKCNNAGTLFLCYKVNNNDFKLLKKINSYKKMEENFLLHITLGKAKYEISYDLCIALNKAHIPKDRFLIKDINLIHSSKGLYEIIF
jgi:2'-5' RNA ligase